MKYQNKADLEYLTDNIWKIHPARMANHLTDGKYIRYKHVEFISQLIAKRILQGNARIIIETPPRHGKSLLISTWTPTWFLELFPNKDVILASYEADFASKWGRAVRDNFINHTQLSTSISQDSSSVSRWNTMQAGGMNTAGAMGAITGKGGDLLLIDDILKNSEQADSENHRKKIIEWWNSTFYTRAEPGASIIVLATRWHKRDLLGYLQSDENETKDDWTVIRLPAIAESSDVIGRKEGDALCPQRYDENALSKIKKAIGSRAWNALYQQRPTDIEGGVIKNEWLRFYDKVPEIFTKIVQSWDLTFKDSNNSDFVVGQVWGEWDKKYYLIDQFRDRIGFVDTCKAIQKMSEKHPNAYAKIIEEKANGSAVMDTLKNKINGIIPYIPTESKESRLNAISPLFESSCVFYPKPSMHSWINVNIEEITNFPNASYDDTVDATSQGLYYMNGKQSVLDKILKM